MHGELILEYAELEQLGQCCQTGDFFVRVNVKRAPELVDAIPPLDKTVSEVMASSERRTSLAVLKNVKKPTRKADHKAR